MSQDKIKMTQLNARIPLSLIDELEKFCNNSMIYKREAIELALRRFLNAEKDKIINASNSKNLY